jgi:hypothetical protein
MWRSCLICATGSHPGRRAHCRRDALGQVHPGAQAARQGCRPRYVPSCSRVACPLLTRLAVDEACASARVTRETSPEEIDKLERRKLELEVEIHALEREKDQASADRLHTARKAIADVEDTLTPLRAAYEAEKHRGDEVTNLRRKIDELKAKADEAERRYDLATASDLRYYALPDAVRE